MIHFVLTLPRRCILLLRFMVIYTLMKSKANLQVSGDILRLRPQIRPGVIAYPLALRGDFAIFLLSALLTMIPATLSVDLSEDRKILYIHGLYTEDRDAFIQEVRRDLETPIAEFCRLT